ncbi:MAG TPA: hypothetical protein VJX71_21595 [Methylomirabilota bacterium]|nr:hypothetical protein [Methylomirabilota bacterium]
MIKPSPTRRRALSLTTLGLLTVALAGCVSQDFIHGAGQSAAAGAMQGVREGIPGLQEPLRQTLRGSLEDPALARAARDMTDSAMQALQARLGSPEMREQVDRLVTQAMESLRRSGDDTVQALVKGAGGQLEAELRKVAASSILAATTTLRDSIEHDVNPATQRLARQMGEQLVASLVAGLEGPMQARLQLVGRNMSLALIKGAAEGADDPVNQAGFGGLTHQVMLQAMRGARQGMSEGLPNRTQVALISALVVLGAMVLGSSGGLVWFWWRYQQSAKTLTIVAESINQHKSDALKDTIQKSAHANYVGPWFSSFLKRRGL